MGRLGLTPDGLTLIGFGITVAGAILLALQQWLIGGIVVFIGGVFDMFDGTLARATGKVSPLGAFMDSVFDRWGEAIVYLGIVVGAVQRRLRRGGDAGRGGHGRGLHGQLRPRQVGGPRLHGRDRHGRGRRHAPRDPARHPQPGPGHRRLARRADLRSAAGETCVESCIQDGGSSSWPLGIIAIGATITVIQRILHVRSQAKSAATNFDRVTGAGEPREQEQRQERQRRRATPGRGPGAAATARSASPSSASATAPAAWSRAATTTRTPRTTTSSRA